MMEWTKEQRDEIITNAMDLCTNIDLLRQVVILTIDNTGMIGVVQKRKDDATLVELAGLYRLLAADTERILMDGWDYTARPNIFEEE